MIGKFMQWEDKVNYYIIVPDNKSRNIPEVVFVRRWAVGVLGIWREGVGWERGGSRWVSLSPTWV
jgi:hypothetical protein